MEYFYCIFLPAYISRFYQEVTLPDNFECDRCTLQLVRHAGEWVAPGGVYRFWSCAVISIVNSSSMSYTKKNCSYPLPYHNTEWDRAYTIHFKTSVLLYVSFLSAQVLCAITWHAQVMEHVTKGSVLVTGSIQGNSVRIKVCFMLPWISKLGTEME